MPHLLACFADFVVQFITSFSRLSSKLGLLPPFRPLGPKVSGPKVMPVRPLGVAACFFIMDVTVEMNLDTFGCSVFG